MTWQPLQRSTPVRNGVEIDIGDEEQWMNHLYVVNKRIMPASADGVGGEDGIHLSIRNQDRSARHDWRDFQRIKNQLAGPDWEAMEIYPAEERLVDSANQWHLWCLPFRIGIGFPTRLVNNQAQVDRLSPGAIQRDFEPVDLKYGGLTKFKDSQAAVDLHYGKEKS